MNIQNQIFAQNDAVPQKAILSFQNEFDPQKRIDVKWGVEEGLFVANFEQNNEKRHVYYSDQGVKLFDKTEVRNKHLNSGVKNYIKDNLRRQQVLGQYKVISNAAPEHIELLIKENGRKYLLIFTPEGEFHYKKEI